VPPPRQHKDAVSGRDVALEKSETMPQTLPAGLHKFSPESPSKSYKGELTP
jgi:hypothetical protein